MATLYAWSPIRSAEQFDEETKKAGASVTKNVGDTVTQDEMYLSDEQWNQLVSSGAVRSYAPPEMPNTFQGSPIDFLKEQARKASEDAVDQVMASPEVLAAITSSNDAAAGQAMLAENVPDEVREEWEQQREDNNPEGNTQEPKPAGNTGTTQVNEANTSFRSTSEGLFASDDGGQNWRAATDEEKAAQK